MQQGRTAVSTSGRSISVLISDSKTLQTHRHDATTMSRKVLRKPIVPASISGIITVYGGTATVMILIRGKRVLFGVGELSYPVAISVATESAPLLENRP